jgi:hypothetical protein
VQQHVATALEHDTPDWRLKNACLSCTYKLKGEVPLLISMQVTMDGNNMQKHIEHTLCDINEAGKLISTTNIKHWDERKVMGDYFLSLEEVDQFAHEVRHHLPAMDASICANLFHYT